MNKHEWMHRKKRLSCLWVKWQGRVGKAGNCSCKGVALQNIQFHSFLTEQCTSREEWIKHSLCPSFLSVQKKAKKRRKQPVSGFFPVFVPLTRSPTLQLGVTPTLSGNIELSAFSLTTPCCTSWLSPVLSLTSLTLLIYVCCTCLSQVHPTSASCYTPSWESPPLSLGTSRCQL